MKEHVLDTLMLVKTFRFPKQVDDFSTAEPVPAQYKNLLMYRMAHEQWQESRIKHSQSDYSQYKLISEKLVVAGTRVDYLVLM